MRFRSLPYFTGVLLTACIALVLLAHKDALLATLALAATSGLALIQVAELRPSRQVALAPARRRSPR